MKMLSPNPETRLTASEVLNHDFFAQDSKENGTKKDIRKFSTYF